MCKLNENYEVNGRTLKWDFFRNSTAEKSTKKTDNNQIWINVPKIDSAIPVKNSYLDIKFDVVKTDDNFRYANKIDKKLFNIGPIALLSTIKLTMSSGKHLEDISHAHIVSWVYPLIASAKYCVDLSILFERDRNSRQRELTDTKNVLGKYNVRIMLSDVFNFAEHQEKLTYGLGYRLVLTRNNDDSISNKASRIDKVKTWIFLSTDMCLISYLLK